MYHSLFGFEKLTDQQIVEKLSILHTRLGHAQDYGQVEMVYQIQAMINSLLAEQSERIARNFSEQQKKEVEKDPSLAGRFGLAPINLGEIADNDDTDDTDDVEE